MIKYSEFIKEDFDPSTGYKTNCEIMPYLTEGYQTKTETGKDKQFIKIPDENEGTKYTFWGVGFKFGKLLDQLSKAEIGDEINNKEGGYKVKRVK